MAGRESARFVVLPIEEIDLGDRSYRFRQVVDNAELRESIRKEGQITPIDVMGDEPPYALISGWSRVTALQALGRKTVNAVIIPEQKRKVAQRRSLAENLRRKDLPLLDQVDAVRRLKEKEKWTTGEL